LRSQLAIDAGTVNTLVYVSGRGIVLEEPSVVAVEEGTRKLIAAGRAAETFDGREPSGVEVVHPLRDGVVTDLPAAVQMLGAFVRTVGRRHGPFRADAVVCVPGGATSVEREALVSAIDGGGRRFRRTTLVSEPVAAALGIEGTLDGRDTLLVVDIGGGTTEVAAVIGGELASTVRARSLRVAGNEMDEAVAEAVRRNFGLLVSVRTGELLKIEFGLRGDEGTPVSVGGIDLVSSSPRSVLVPGNLVTSALERPVAQIVGAVRAVLSELPPRVAEEVMDKGIWLAGGGALLAGLAGRFSEATGIETRIAPDPLRCVVRGTATVLESGGGERRCLTPVGVPA